MRECLSCGYVADGEFCPADGGPTAPSLSGEPLIDGRYRLLQRVGAGGMGLVYRAMHVDLRRELAIKLIRPTGGTDHEAEARFRLEALALGRLRHPAIVKPTDFGVDDRGWPYLVMELVEGRTLYRRLGDGPLPVEEALAIFGDLATALDHAHAEGILHRDLKPGNIVMTPAPAPGQPRALILDFGLARFADLEAAPVSGVGPRAPSSDSGPLTGEGLIIGTPGYMAPEVIAGEPPSAKSDLYSFAVTLYEALVGRHPDGRVEKGRPDPLKAMDHPPPAPSSVRRVLPSELDDVLVGALDPNPDSRPSSATALVAALSLAWWRAQARHQHRRHRRRLAKLAVPVLALAALFGLGFGALEPTALTERRLADRLLALSPDRAPDPRFVLVSIDEASLAAFPEPMADWGGRFGQLMDRAFAAGARGVAIDLLGPSVWSTAPEFAQAVAAHAGRVLLAASTSGDGRVIGPEVLGPLLPTVLGSARVSRLFAFVNIEDDIDGVVREMHDRFPDADGKVRPSFAHRVAELAAGHSLPWAGTPRPRVDFQIQENAFRRLSFVEALAVEPATYADRVLLVGGEYAASGDVLFRLPERNRRGFSSGLSLQALMANTALSGYPVRSWTGPVGRMVFGALIGALLLAASARTRTIPAWILAVLGIVVVYLTGAAVMAAAARTSIPVVSVAAAAVLVAGTDLLLRPKGARS